MDALSFACNIIDLVGKAAKVVGIVVEVYESVDGLNNINDTINREADGLRDIISNLQECDSQAAYKTADEKMRQISTTVISQCVQLQSVLDSCRSSKRWGIFSAAKASAVAFWKRGDIEKLQGSIASSQDELFRWITANTRADVKATLKRLGAISQTNCEIQTTLNVVNDRLGVALRSTDSLPENGATACLDEIRQLVADRVILQLLDFPDLGARFEDVVTQEEGTFKWIFTEPEVAFKKEPELATTFPDWLESGDGIFHICGKPGAGKSTLMKYICRNPTTEELLAKWSGNNELLFAKFFFWRIGGAEQKSIKGLIRGLLYQILCKVPKLSRVIFSKETRNKLVDDLQKHSGAKLESDEIIAAFSRLVEVSTSPSPCQDIRGVRICLFVDGLDEFDDTKINQSYRKLVEELWNWATNSNGHIKICASSRMEAPFMDMLDESKRFRLHKLTRKDIELFIERQLGAHPTFQKHQQKIPKECEKLIDSIRSSAQGVFFYVALVVKELKIYLDYGSPIKSLQKVISEMPKDLETLLERIMDSIPKNLRDGVDVLFAALLRSTGSLLSVKDRDSDDIILHKHAPPHDFSALSAFIVLRATDKGFSMLEDVTMDKFDIEKEEWFENDMNYDEAMKAVCNTIGVRCKGLIETVESNSITRSVRFIHRSVPDFLHTYFSRRAAFGLHHDHEATLVMSWSYLVDTKWVTANDRGASLISFLCGEDAVDKSAKPKWGIFRSNTWFVGVLRQLKLGDEWEDLFRILVLIDEAGLGDKSSVIDECASSGLHEFIDWLFRKTNILTNGTRLFRVMRAAIDSTDSCYDVYSTLRVMETVFAHGVDGRMVIPPGEEFAGCPLWHYVLVILANVRWEFRRNINETKTKALLAETVELWLRNGANPRVRLQLSSEGGRRYMKAWSAPDTSRYVRDSWDDVTIDGRLPPALRGEGKKELSLRGWVLHEKFHNESRLLDLLKDDTEDDMFSAQKPAGIEQSSSEISEGGSSLPEEATIVWSISRWAMHNSTCLYIDVVLIGVLGLKPGLFSSIYPALSAMSSRPRRA